MTKKEEKKEKAAVAKTEKPVSAIKRMIELIKKKATDEEITNAFTEIYHAKGKRMQNLSLLGLKFTKR